MKLLPGPDLLFVLKNFSQVTAWLNSDTGFLCLILAQMPEENRPVCNTDSLNLVILKVVIGGAQVAILGKWIAGGIPSQILHVTCGCGT